MRAIVVALGSNLGARDRHIRTAADALARILDDFTLSSIIETAPVGSGLENDPPYLNAVGVGKSDRSATEIFDTLRTLEREAERERPYPGAPRTLDLDLILVGNEVIDTPHLQVPHPRFRDRLFVLDPLSEIAPDLIDPVTGTTIRELQRSARKKGRS